MWIQLQDIPGCDVDKLIDPVDGEKVYRRCYDMRRPKERCGPDGDLFEPKESKQ